MELLDTSIVKAKEFYNKVEDLTKKRPIAIIISNIALIILSVFISPLSYILALGVFSFSLFFSASIIKNFEKVCERIEEQVIQIFMGPEEAARAKGKSEGREFIEKVSSAAARIKGFFDGISDEILS